VSTEHDRQGKRVDRFFSQRGSLLVELLGESFPVKKSVMAAGDSALGRGVHGAIPLHLRFDAENISLKPNQSLKYRLVLRPTRS
jgi:hypothetical protein